MQNHLRRTLFFAGYGLTILLFLPVVNGCSAKEENPKGAGGGAYYTGPIDKPVKKEPE